MLTMARGDECKTAAKAQYACKQFLVADPKKPAMTSTSYQPKQEPKKDYGSWGPVFKDKKTFLDMHHC